MAPGQWPTAVASRRRLLANVLTALACLPLAGALVAMVRQRHRGRAPRRVRVVPDFRDGVVFADEVIVCLDPDGRLAAFSSACTHLGCRISRVDDGMLVCPCHGSRFRHDGSVATGPATAPLRGLAFVVDAATGAVIVDVT